MSTAPKLSDEELEIMSKISVAHVPADLTLQCNIIQYGLTVREAQAIGLALNARSDVRSSSVSYQGWLNLVYNSGSLSGKQREEFVKSMQQVVRQAIAHKLIQKRKVAATS